MIFVNVVINHCNLLNTEIALEIFKFSKGHKVNPAVAIVQNRGKE